jgi:hypothetical protein
VARDLTQLDLNRLRARRGEKPRTKAGQVRQAWPEIRELIAAGHSLKDIWKWVNEIGIEIGYARLSHYVGQLRRNEPAVQIHAQRLDATAQPMSERSGHASLNDGSPNDPLANLRAREQQPPGFNYNPDIDLKKLI